MNYELSIIVPVYKVEPYIHKCIISILSQTFTSFELILVDDGSPDKCGEICDEYARKDTRVRVLHKENGGLSSARNAGIDIAQGEYISFIDSDDYIDKDMYESMFYLSRKYDADVVECGFSKVRGNEIEPIIHKEGTIVGDNLFALGLLAEFGLHSLACNKIYRRYLFDGVRFPFGKIHEDEFVMHKIFLSLKRYVYLGKSEYFYVQREGSIMAEGYSLKTLNRLEAYEERYYFLKNNINEQSILSLVEYRYFNEIMNNYFSLSANSKLDPDRSLRKNLRKHILKNCDAFLKNELISRFRKSIILMRLNQNLFDIVYFLYRHLSKWYFNFKYKLRNFMKLKFKWVSRLRA